MIRSHDIELPLEASDFRALFNAERGTVGIYFREKLTEVIWFGVKPGKSVFAAKESRAALPMVR